LLASIVESHEKEATSILRVSAALRVTGQREVVQYDGRSGEEDIDGEMAVGRPAARTIASKT